MIFLGKYKELCNNQEYPSMVSSFSDAPYEGQEKIIHYLKTAKEDMCRMAKTKDVFTGAIISSSDIGRNDGVYTWFESLAYYIEKYNLRLPKDFENKVLNK